MTTKVVYEIPRENRIVTSLREARKIAKQDHSSIIVRSARTNAALRVILPDRAGG